MTLAYLPCLVLQMATFLVRLIELNQSEFVISFSG